MPRRHFLATCVTAAAVLGAPALAGAEDVSEFVEVPEAVSAPVQQRQVQIGRQSDGAIVVSAELPLTLPRLVEEALYQGVPIYFVQEAQVLRERWYWTDQQAVVAQRYLRLSYQPLTRRWRLAVAQEPFTSGSLGSALAQPFSRLEHALSAMQRIGHWRIAPASALRNAQPYVLVLSFKLDWSYLPRPLQIGAIGQSEWNVSQTYRQRFELQERAP